MKTTTDYYGDKRVSLDESHVANSRAKAHNVVRYHADVEVWTPHADGFSSNITHFSCDHDHTTPEAASSCGARLARVELKKYAS